MANYSDIFPLNVGGSNIAGFNWTEKTADFVAESNQAYYCDTALGDILMTLPSNPSPGDEVAFLILGANALNITTTDNIKSAPLATDSLKQVTENYLMVILFYEDNTVGWNWDIRYDPYISGVYTGAGFTYFKIEWNGTLTEIQYELSDGIKRIMKEGEEFFSGLVALNTFQYAVPNLAAISNGIVPSATNAEYIGAINGTFPAILFTATQSILIKKIWIAGQTQNNNPTIIRVFGSADNINFYLIKEDVRVKADTPVGSLTAIDL